MSNPQSRNEAILQNILGEDNTLTPPQSRAEELLQAILTHGEYDKEPQSRNEALLADMLEEVDTKLIPENIKKDVEIFGTVGTLEGGSSVDVEALSVDQNGTYTAPEGTAYSPVTVNVSGGGGQEVPEKDVNFIDYDGTVLYSYTAQEALALTALPANPSHEGLTAQGWNYTLAEVKTEVNAVGGATVGQMYIPDNGKTRIYIHIDDSTPSSALRFFIRFRSSIANNSEVNWGDGTVEILGSTTTTNYPHVYEHSGDYVITIDVKSGTIKFAGTNGSSGNSIYGSRKNDNSFNRNRIRKIYVGANVTDIETYTFAFCYSLDVITIPSTVENIGSTAFSDCNALSCVILPSNTTITSDFLFYDCRSLTKVSIPFNTTIIGSHMFSNCVALIKVNIPSTVTSINYTAFENCYALDNIVIPHGVSSINSSIFTYCLSMTNITIPSTVTTIGTSPFNGCYGMLEYHLEPISPPTMSSSGGLYTDTNTVVYVPYSADHSILEAYKTATNWSTYATKMQEEPA